MGVAEIKDAFNSIDPRVQCERVLVWLERDDAGKEWQVMRFSGKRDGTPFEATTNRHSPADDVVVTARAIAQNLSTGGDIERTSAGNGQSNGGGSA